ncbi:MAG: N-acyl-D-amino-acid deacylase family protein, partial [Actinomycetota bacterium]
SDPRVPTDHNGRDARPGAGLTGAAEGASIRPTRGDAVLDVVIKGGEVVDGTGAARVRADVGIRGDRIVAIGRIDEEAARTIDATGKLVAPGFIDVHTHFDAQVFWDQALTPSPLHGVTTALAGNCGFTVAPLSGDPSDAEYLLRMLARVEGMPVETLRTGVPWDWTSTADYFDRIESTGVGINLGFMIGHSAIRRVVMGVDATRRSSTPEELERMKTLLRAGLEAGGLGFSTSYARTHNDADGNMVPSRHATTAELIELARVTGEFPGTGLEIIPQVGPFEPWAVELMADMSAAAQRPVNWNVMVVTHGNREECESKLTAGDVARARGGKVVALTMPISFGARFSFASGFVLDAMPGWEAAMHSSRDEKLALFRDRDARNALNEKAQSRDNPLRMIADWGTKIVFDTVAPENEQYRGQTVGAIAEAEGRDPWDVLCDIAVADELNTSFGTPTPVETLEDWDARLQVWRDPRAVIGASDAGAHFDLLASFNYATGLLERAVRRHEVLSFEEAIHLMTQVQADLYGIRERGLLREGWYADVIVIDPHTVGTDEPAMTFDLPGREGRLYAEATGIDHVLVNGTAIVSDGALTSGRSGVLLRSGRDTATPALV